jgi:hypothetical protein
MSRHVFPIGSRWTLYDGEVPNVHIIVEHETTVGKLITECDGQRFEWHPAVWAWVAEPEQAA